MDSLSLREHHVALLVGSGSTNKEVAHTLGITEPMAKKYVSKILAKLGARNRCGICRWLVASTPVGKVDVGGG